MHLRFVFVFLTEGLVYKREIQCLNTNRGRSSNRVLFSLSLSFDLYVAADRGDLSMATSSNLRVFLVFVVAQVCLLLLMALAATVQGRPGPVIPESIPACCFYHPDCCQQAIGVARAAASAGAGAAAAPSPAWPVPACLRADGCEPFGSSSGILLRASFFVDVSTFNNFYSVV